MLVALPGLSADHFPKVVASFERTRSQERGNYLCNPKTISARLRERVFALSAYIDRLGASE
jgi:hypothetical protein